MRRNANEHRTRRLTGIARLMFLLSIVAVVQLMAASIVFGQGSASRDATSANQVQTIRIVLARELRDLPPPLSLLDARPQDDGIAGARLAINDNNTTGRFLKQEFVLDIVQNEEAKELIAEVMQRVAVGASFVVADVNPQTVIALADALKGRDALIFNAGSSDDQLREKDCRHNVVHTAPSRTMLADGLAQYLRWKRWQRWFLVQGTEPEDEAFAEALRRAAKRFGSKIVEERPFKYEVGSRRADGGYEQIQEQIPALTQKAPDHDVLVVADESGLFGEYLPYRTWDARPVAGTHGLVPTSWHPAHTRDYGRTEP